MAPALWAWPAEMPGWVIDGSDRNEQGGWVKDGVRRPEKTHALTQEGVKGLKRRQFGPPLPVQPVYYPPLAGSHEKRMVRFRRIPTAVLNVPDSVPPFPSITHPTAAPNLPAWAWRSAVSTALEIFRLICARLLLIRQDGPARRASCFLSRSPARYRPHCELSDKDVDECGGHRLPHLIKPFDPMELLDVLERRAAIAAAVAPDVSPPCCSRPREDVKERCDLELHG
jgi:hypothetical protein